MSLIQSLLGLRPKKIEPVLPPATIEELVIQTMLWREYIKYIRDNNIPIDKVERQLIDETYKVLRQEIKVRLMVIRRTVKVNFAQLLTVSLEKGGFQRQKPAVNQSTKEVSDVAIN